MFADDDRTRTKPQWLVIEPAEAFIVMIIFEISFTIT